MSTSTYDVVVIGSGIAGLTATKALLTRRRTLAVANIESELFGGLVMNINELEGTIQGSGVDLASALLTEAAELGASTLSEAVVSIAESAGGWIVETSTAKHHARVVIVASGAHLKRLGVPGEETFEHRGVSRCADCDGPMYSGMDVVVAGGGDSALQEAHVLSKFCRQVHVVNRAERFTAQRALVDAIERCGNVRARHASEVDSIFGNDMVEGVIVRSLADGTTSEVACGGIFGFIGLEPSSSFVPPSIARDQAGFLITDASLRAGPRLFVAGAVRSGHGGMLEHAVAEGLAAADAAIGALS
jgi:thioredoxin reductase (NADPH)